VKIGIVGAGNIARFHVEAFRAAGAEVVAVCTRSSSAKAFAEAQRISGSHQSITEMLEKSRPEAVCILTQPESYLSVLQELKPKNLPVFIEKPLGYTVREAEGLRPFLPQKVFIGLNRRFYGGIRAIREKVHSSNGIFAQLFLPDRHKDFSQRNEKTRQNWPMLNGIHGVDLLTHLVGPPRRMLATEGWGKMEGETIPRFQAALYEADRETRVTFMTNFDSSGGWRLHFFLPQEEIIISPFEETKIKKMTGIELIPTVQEDKNHKPGFVAQARCFLQGCQSADLPDDWVSFDDAIQSMRVIHTLFGQS
jgi:predicted dehydrogenase